MQEPEHVALRQRCDQQLFGVVAVRVAQEDRVRGGADGVLADRAYLVGAFVAAVRAGALSGIAGPHHIDLVAVPGRVGRGRCRFGHRPIVALRRGAVVILLRFGSQIRHLGGVAGGKPGLGRPSRVCEGSPISPGRRCRPALRRWSGPGRRCRPSACNPTGRSCCRRARRCPGVPTARRRRRTPG